jgi:hypothetical protein
VSVRAVAKAVAVAAALFAVTACRTAHAQKELPAVILNPTTESREALTRAVSAALGGAPVTLADDALTAGSELVVERARLRDPRGLPANGRELRVPEHFRLVTRGGDCVLVHERGGERSTLPGTVCAPR